MSSSIATLITRCRKRLHDEDSGAYRWTDAHLTEHLEAAIREYSDFYPQQKKTTIATTAGTRDMSLSSLTDLIRVEAVEWPVSQYPKIFVRFSVWVTTLTLLIDGAPDGTNSSVYWLAPHDTTTPTHPVWHDELIVLGACIYAAYELASRAVDQLNVTGESTSRFYLDWAQRNEPRYREWLERGRRVLRQRSLYVPSLGRESQTTDPGPG